MFKLFNRYDQTPGELNVSAQDLKARLAKGEKVVLLDVREQWEYDTAKIEGATLIPMTELQSRYTELKPEDDIVVYCHMGVRGLKALNFLKEKGYKTIKNLSGGIDAWSNQVDSSVPKY